MDARDLELRNHVYHRFVELGRAPALGELAEGLGRPVGETEARLRALHEARQLVLEPDRPEIRMANPFSAVPTPYRVEAGGRRWYANCVWDSFGIPAALGVDGHISTSCADCGEPLEVDVVSQRPAPADGVAHILLPARLWWDDIVFT
jgi:alkylmercury lyase-like protein